MATSPSTEEAALSALADRDRALAFLDDGNATDAALAAERALGTLESAGLGHELDAVAVLVALAEINEVQGLFASARQAAEQAAALVEPFMADADSDTVVLWSQAHERLANLERISGDFTAAEARLVSVLDRAAAVFGEGCLQVASAANALGILYKYAGRFDEADAAYRRAMAAVDGAGGADPLTRACLLHNLGGLAHSRGRPQEGIPAAEAGLALRVEALGELHPDTGRDLNALGALYELADRVEDAADAYDQALAVFEACYGPDHFEVAMVCANQAVLVAGQGDGVEAERLGHRALTIFEELLGPDDAEVALTLLNLGVAVASQERLDEALTLVTRAEAILTKKVPAGHPQLVVVEQTLVELKLRP
jgi:tetratricopeptide (TPR) repeat protein